MRDASRRQSVAWRMLRSSDETHIRSTVLCTTELMYDVIVWPPWRYANLEPIGAGIAPIRHRMRARYAYHAQSLPVLIGRGTAPDSTAIVLGPYHRNDTCYRLRRAFYTVCTRLCVFSRGRTSGFIMPKLRLVVNSFRRPSFRTEGYSGLIYIIRVVPNGRRGLYQAFLGTRKTQAVQLASEKLFIYQSKCNSRKAFFL